MRVYLDACAIIYAVEGERQIRERVVEWMHKAEASQGGSITSRLARLECRVKPLRDQNQTILRFYDGFFTRVEIHEITPEIIETATELRANFNFKTPDAIHLATAIIASAEAFITGDSDLARIKTLNVQIL